MKKMIVAVLVVVVLLALALAQPAVAPKKEKPPKEEPKELATLTLRVDLVADVTGIEDFRCNKKPSDVFLENIEITFNDRGDTREADDPEENTKAWNDFEGRHPGGTVIINTKPGQFKLEDPPRLRFVFHFNADGSEFTGRAPFLSLVFFGLRDYTVDQGTCTLALAQPTVDATIKENARVVVWSGTLDLTLKVQLPAPS